VQTQRSTADAPPGRRGFLVGVFLITFAVLVFQVVQTRILSVVAWYYLAFFAISVAMLGMTAGAVWVYLRRDQLEPRRLSTVLSDMSWLAAVAMPVSVAVQFCLVITMSPTVTFVVAWVLLVASMTVPYVFAGIAVSLALTRSPFPVSQVYGVDLLGAATGCAAVIGILDVLDGPSAILAAALAAALAAHAFATGATPPERNAMSRRRRWRHPLTAALALALLIPLNASVPAGLRPVMVKDRFETQLGSRTERWNSYSRIVAYPPVPMLPSLWGASPHREQNLRVPQAMLNIDGLAGTYMHHFDGTAASIGFLGDDVVNLAYRLPGMSKSAVIGVGGGRDLMAAHLFGVKDITGIEVNPIFVDLHTKDPFFAPYSNLRSMPGLTLHVADARSWFAGTDESFDLIQMSMIDTWAATGAGAFSLSENGLYTLEGWRAFVSRLTSRGVLTVSRWYNEGDVNETGRMIGLALATLIDSGATDPRQHLFVARTANVATLILSKSPISPENLGRLRAETERLGFGVLLAPDTEPRSDVLRRMMASRDLASLNAASATALLDLSVPTDNRPFFFNQMRFSNMPEVIGKMFRHELGGGVLRGNLNATIALVLILVIALLAVVCTIIVPLRASTRGARRPLLAAGTMYFSLIGMGFMFAEISLLQFFGVFLGHPIYAMSVCLFSLILSSGLGSLASMRLPLDTPRRLAVWGAGIGAYFLIAQAMLTDLFELTSAQALPVRVAICVAVVMPVGFAMGFGFPTGVALVERVDAEPTPWFWGINGATGVLASVLAVMIGMAFGINVTMAVAGLCYLGLIPTGRALLALSTAPASASQLPAPSRVAESGSQA
jgi:hypothetical protein